MTALPAATSLKTAQAARTGSRGAPSAQKCMTLWRGPTTELPQDLRRPAPTSARHHDDKQPARRTGHLHRPNNPGPDTET
jgi:hypothetical protein